MQVIKWVLLGIAVLLGFATFLAFGPIIALAAALLIWRIPRLSDRLLTWIPVLKTPGRAALATGAALLIVWLAFTPRGPLAPSTPRPTASRTAVALGAQAQVQADHTAPAELEQAQATAEAEDVPTEPSTPDLTASPAEASEAPGDVAATVAAEPNKAQVVADYLERNFGMPGYQTTWYGALRQIEVQGNQVTVTIATLPSPYAKSVASAFCSAVSGFVYARGNESLGLTRIVVRAESGQILVRRGGAPSTCA